MREIKACEVCGADVEYRIEGSIQGIFCTQCDWAVVTTHISKIAQDTTRYQMYLFFADANNKDHIKALAKVANINFSQAKKMTQEDQPLIIEDRAITIDKARKIFNNLSIKYNIFPSFPY